jgi:ABC-type multidrug transport system ATPase subunit
MEQMTVYENLDYFCNLRNMQQDAIEKYIDHMLREVSIPDKKHAIVGTLSGGQKRKV